MSGVPGSRDVSGMVANVLQCVTIVFVLLRTAAVARITESTNDHSIHSNGSSATDGEVLRGFSSDSDGSAMKPTEHGQSFTSQQWWHAAELNFCTLIACFKCYGPYGSFHNNFKYCTLSFSKNFFPTIALKCAPCNTYECVLSWLTVSSDHFAWFHCIVSLNKALPYLFCHYHQGFCPVSIKSYFNIYWNIAIISNIMHAVPNIYNVNTFIQYQKVHLLDANCERVK
jgi:hypothetical protein